MTNVQNTMLRYRLLVPVLALLFLGALVSFAVVAKADDSTTPPETTENTSSDNEEEQKEEQEKEQEEEQEENGDEETGGENAKTTPEDEEGSDGEDGEDGVPNEDTENTDPGEDGEHGDPNENGENGEDGEEGENTDTPAEPDGEPAVIETGNSSSTASGTTEANTTEITTPGGGGGGSDDDTTVELDNALAATSTASSTSATGENIAEDPDGVLIKTGTSSAFGYLITLFNVAITNSTGSILFLRNPLGSMLDFTERIMNAFNELSNSNGECSFVGCALPDAAFNLINGNVGEVTNELEVRAGTGNNSGSSSDGPVGILTGDAQAGGGIFTFGNLQIVDSRYLVILMNNEGDLNGNIILPDPEFFHELSTGATLGRGSTLYADSTAEVENQGTSSALTGENTTETEGLGGIATGDASAQTSVHNFINQIGAPICFIVTVGGDWNGDIYQLPDGFSRESTPFGELICGAGGGEGRTPRGDFHATTTNYAKVLNKAIVEATTGGNAAEGMEAYIETGDAEAFLQILNVLNQSIIGQDWIFALFTIMGDWNGDLIFGVLPGADPIDDLAGRILSGGKSRKTQNSNPQIAMYKTASVSQTSTPGVVEYSITIKNFGGKLFNATLIDTLRDPTGAIINTEEWDLHAIQPKETITIKYAVEFGADVGGGAYTNTATLTGTAQSSSKDRGIPIKPIKASASVELLPSSLVLGANICPAYLTKYVTPNGNNDPEQVRLLEVFLRESEGLDIVPDGTYDNVSVKAIKNFQAENSKDILSPWGIENATGHVYYTTRKKINELYCQGYSEFALTKTQLAEIERYRSFAFGQGPVMPVVVEGPSSIPYVSGGSLQNTPYIKHIAPRNIAPKENLFTVPIFDTLFGWLQEYATIPHAEAAQ